MSVKKNTPNFLKHHGLSFTTIINQTMDLIPDAGALGIYCYLASKSENWNICIEHLKNRFNKGRDYIRKMLDILTNIGLIKKESIRDAKGKILYWETTLVNFVDTPIQQQFNNEKLSTVHITENPECGKSRRLEKTALLNKRNKPIKEKKRNKRERHSHFFSPNLEGFNILQATEKRTGIDSQIILDKFKALTMIKKWTKEQLQAKFILFCLNERMNDNKINNIPNNPAPKAAINLVKEWAQGNPDYDRFHGLNNNFLAKDCQKWKDCL